MNKHLCLKNFVLLFFLVSINCYAQKTRAILTFDNDSIVKGFAEIINSEKLKFKNRLEEKPQKLSTKGLKSISFIDGENRRTYIVLKKEQINKPILLEEILVGDVNLYRVKNTSSYGTGAGGLLSGGSSYVSNSGNSNEYYVKRKNQESYFNILNSEIVKRRNFRIIASEFFSSCETLKDKIFLEAPGFQKENLVEIVGFYNIKCK